MQKEETEGEKEKANKKWLNKKHIIISCDSLGSSSSLSEDVVWAKPTVCLCTVTNHTPRIKVPLLNTTKIMKQQRSNRGLPARKEV